MMNDESILQRSSFVIPTVRADLYSALAEALSDPPEWMAGPGREWPLFAIATRLASDTRCLEMLADIRAEPLAGRRKRYATLFVGSGRPRFWLYESAFLTGRILGPETFAVEKLYRAAGLDTLGAELPDHASMELAFLAHLAENVETTGPVAFTDMERRFIEAHAGRWLPQLGRALAQSGDEVYAPIGQLLADWLEEAGRKQKAGGRKQSADCRPPAAFCLPHIPQAESCTLCGFCVQVCPTRALAIRETSAETALVLNAGACVSCGKCERVCEMRALRLSPHPPALSPVRNGAEQERGSVVLRRSPRAVCPACGQPTISRAELDFVAAQIGYPAWLEYCGDCRPQLMENPR
jgi:TorA maturation chaperone TorD/NAD-dependent dihydropyrimidine dehydrogenase PreA subunit